MKVLKVLGSERMYLMSDGSKISFDDKEKIFKKIETVTIEEAIEVLEQKPKNKRKYKRKKKEV